MRKILIAGAALALLGATAAHADDSDKEALGGAAGGAAGAAAGAVVGGPIGAIVGGVAGFAIGAEAAVPEDARVYVMENPTPPVIIQRQVTADTRFDNSVTLTPIPDTSSPAPGPPGEPAGGKLNVTCGTAKLLLTIARMSPSAYSPQPGSPGLPGCK